MTKTNIKLRAVEIDAFRGFANPVKFDFVTGDGQIANLVIIFAPNGFGKTSFFEGVEWSVKGKIERIDENPTIRHAAEKEKGNILKNHHSSLTRGRVRLIDSDGAFFERSTSSSKNWDLLPGLLNKKSTSPIFEGLKVINKNKHIEILPQSRIDSFLSSRTPQQKYEALLDFWGGKDDSAYYVGVSKLVEYTRTDIDEISDSIIILEKEISEIAKSESRMAVFNALTGQINLSGLFDKKLTPFDQNSSQQTLKTTTNDLMRMIAQLDLQLKSAVNNNALLSGLALSADAYFHDLKETGTLQARLRDLEKTETDFKTLQSRLIEQNKVKSQIAAVKNELGQLELIAALQQDFADITRTIRLLGDEKQALMLAIQEYATSRSQLTADAGELNKQLKQVSKDQETVAKNSDIAADFQKRVTANLAKVPHATARLETAKRIKASYDQRVQALSGVISHLQNTLRQPIQVFVTGTFDYEPLVAAALEIKSMFARNNNLKQEILAAEGRLLKLGSLDENLQKLIEFGRHFVIDTQTDTCPLCDTKQEDFGTLIALIERQKTDALGTADLNSELSVLKDELKVREEDINRLFGRFIIDLQLQEQALVGDLRTSERASIIFAGYVQYYESVISLANTENERFLTEITRLSVQNDQLAQKIINVETTKSQLANDIQRHTQLLNANKIDADNAKTKLTEIETKIRFENNQSVYLSVLAYLKKENIAEAEFLKNGLTGRKTILQGSLAKQEAGSAEVESMIAALQKLKLPVDILPLTQEIASVKKQSKDLSGKTVAFVNKYHSLLNSRDISKKSINNAINKFNKTIKQFTRTMLQLRELQENMASMQTSIYLNTKRNTLARTQDQLNELKASEIKLAALKEQISDFLSEKINAVFNQQTINDIYQKIDPHPELKQIKLEPKFDEVKPTLNILAADEDGTRPVDPALYLSSAQVNILSLSIFLAKALQNNDTLINTIFMDDPIQYLDSINVLSFIDLMRIIITDKKIDRQLVISTHDENFFKLLQRKFDPDYYPSKFIQFASYGKLV